MKTVYCIQSKYTDHGVADICCSVYQSKY